jgi:hypothetical protein
MGELKLRLLLLNIMATNARITLQGLENVDQKHESRVQLIQAWKTHFQNMKDYVSQVFEDT